MFFRNSFKIPSASFQSRSHSRLFAQPHIPCTLPRPHRKASPITSFQTASGGTAEGSTCAEVGRTGDRLYLWEEQGVWRREHRLCWLCHKAEHKPESVKALRGDLTQNGQKRPGMFQTPSGLPSAGVKCQGMCDTYGHETAEFPSLFKSNLQWPLRICLPQKMRLLQSCLPVPCPSNVCNGQQVSRRAISKIVSSYISWKWVSGQNTCTKVFAITSSCAS